MGNQEIIDVILSDGLSLRQIPYVIIEVYSIAHHKEGNEIETVNVDYAKINMTYEGMKKRFSDRVLEYSFNDETKTVTRNRTVSKRIPNHPGHWMCKRVNNTDSMVRWNIKEDNLAPTLSESIQLYLNKKNK